MLMYISVYALFPVAEIHLIEIAGRRAKQDLCHIIGTVKRDLNGGGTDSRLKQCVKPEDTDHRAKNNRRKTVYSH